MSWPYFSLPPSQLPLSGDRGYGSRKTPSSPIILFFNSASHNKKTPRLIFALAGRGEREFGATDVSVSTLLGYSRRSEVRRFGSRVGGNFSHAIGDSACRPE